MYAEAVSSARNRKRALGGFVFEERPSHRFLITCAYNKFLVVVSLFHYVVILSAGKRFS